jgi:hypothetical protein
MPEFRCPACQAEIEPDLVERTGEAQCPFCGADLSDLGLPEPALDEGLAETRDAAGPPPTGEPTRALPPVPAGSAIRVVESTADRLVLFIPAGGKNVAGLGCFALAWNLFMAVFTTGWIFGSVRGANQNNPPSPLVIVPVFSLFWVVGGAMAWFWLRARFERTFLLLDRERIVIQRILLGRKRLAETALGTASRAALVESYQQNDRPVYRVEVTGDRGAAKFGTPLGADEKDWLVDRINEFLGVRTEEVADDDEPPAGDSSRATDGPAAPRFSDTADPRSAPAGEPDCADTHLDIVESTPDRLTLWYAVARGSPVRLYGPLFLLAFSAIWLGFVGFAAKNALEGPLDLSTIFHALFFLPFIAVGLVLVTLALYIAFGRTTIDLTRVELVCRWSIGPFHCARRLPTGSLTSIRVVRKGNTARNSRVRKNRGSSSGSGPYTMCVASDGVRTLPLTLFNDEPLARQIASLVNLKWHEMGFRPADD